MNKKVVLEKTRQMIKDKLKGEGSGHDWWHIYRVAELSKTIANKEKANLFIVELSALLHDIADHKFHDGDETQGGKVTRKWLKSLGVDDRSIDKVVHIVDNVSFKGGRKNRMELIEGKIVQDADRLDAIGAIGIARCFAYGGYKGDEIYNPEIKPNVRNNNKQKINYSGTAINHFYEKLLLLKDLMNTETGKEFAASRHDFLESYLEEFFKEWEGKQ